MRPRTMQMLRRWHLYIGMIFAPAIIFFAFSGAIQTIGLQDEPSPPKWISTIASIHKKQMLARPRKARPAPPKGEGDRRQDGAAKAPASSPFLLKAFVLLLSVGLILSAALGIVVALANRATRRVSAIMLAIGVVLPPLLLFL